MPVPALGKLCTRYILAGVLRVVVEGEAVWTALHMWPPCTCSRPSADEVIPSMCGLFSCDGFSLVSRVEADEPTLRPLMAVVALAVLMMELRRLR